MSDDAESISPKADETPGQPTTNIEPAKRGGFRLWRVALTTLPMILAAIGIFLFFGVFEGTQWLEDVTKPPLVPVEGNVTYKGEPLVQGQVSTVPLKPGLRGAIGFIDSEGHFNLRTDIKGTYQDGAYEGEHVVVITKRGPPRGAAPPALVTPAAYADPDKTPFRIVVRRPPAENEHSFTLEDSADEKTVEPPSESKAPNDRESNNESAGRSAE